MIIKEIELAGWRKINLLKLGLSGGINILFGKNEIGKSTIIEAIRFAFFEKSESDSRDVKKVVSWNTNVKSNASLTFSAGNGNIYRINKSFPKGNAELYLLKNKLDKKISEGKKVNDDILEILGINGKVINLFDLLWISQGRTLSLFEKNSELESSELQTEIKSIIKSNIVSKKTEDLYKTVCENYEGYYSSKTNKFRIDIIKLKEAFEEKKKMLDEVNLQIDSVTGKTAEMNAILAKIESTGSNMKKIKARIEKLETLKAEADKTEKLRIRYDFIRKDYEKLLLINEENAALEKEIPELLKELKTCLIFQKESEESNITDYNALKKQEAELDLKLGRYSVRDQRIIDEIISLKNRIEIINNQLSLNQIKVRIEPARKINYRIKSGSSESDMNTDEKKEFYSDEKINIDIKATASISISAPIPRDKINELKKTLEISVNRLNELFKTAGTDDIGKIRREYDEFKNQSSEKDKIKMKMAGFDIKKTAGTVKSLQKDIEIISLDNSGVKINKNQNIELKIQNLKNEIIKKQNRLNSGRQQYAEIIRDSTFDEFRINYLKMKDEIDLQEKKLTGGEFGSQEDITARMNSAKKELENDTGELINLTGVKSRLEADSNVTGSLLKNKAEMENELENISLKRKNELAGFYSFRLLKELIEEEKKSLDDKIILPLQERISEEFRKLTSSNYENINLNKDLSFDTADAKTMDGKKASINFNDISLGTREQLSFIFRFVIAQYLSANENPVMILDDSFVNTDLKRFGYILEKIKSFQDKMQFLIFTCRENDYKNVLDNVNYIDLEKLIY